MKRPLLRSSAFVRAAQKVVKKYPQNAIELQSALELLQVDAFHRSLRTHKLKGELKDSWACSAGYDLRIVHPTTAKGAAVGDARVVAKRLINATMPATQAVFIWLA